MEISLAGNQANWNFWLTEQGGSFLQSWEWGEVLASEGKTVERLQVVDGGIVVAQAQVVYADLFLGWRYGFCPSGPIVKLAINKEQATSVWECLKDYFFSRKIIFLRVEPQGLLIDSCSLLVCKSLDITPRATTVIDLTKSDENLLAAMHEKTRYNIRLAQKKNLVVSDKNNVDTFWDLLEKTGARDKFKLHNKKHYQAVLTSPFSLQLTVCQGEQPLASAIFIGFDSIFTYLFGASDHEYRNLMGPHLLQWEAIKLGRKLGFIKYDFFGVAPRCHSERSEESLSPITQQISVKGSFAPTQDDNYKYDRQHQYAGVTRFKLGFGGNVIEGPGTHDLLISPIKYRVYQALRWLRRLV